MMERNKNLQKQYKENNMKFAKEAIHVAMRLRIRVETEGERKKADREIKKEKDIEGGG